MFSKTLDRLDNADDLDESSVPAPSTKKPETASSALGHVVLDAALTRAARARFLRRPSLVIVEVPHGAWCDLLEVAVHRLDERASIREIPTATTRSGVITTTGLEDLRTLDRGTTVVYITPEPTIVLDNAILAAADVTIAIPPLTPLLLRRAIRRMTGGVARGVTEQMAALDIPVILAALRPGMRAGACVAVLQRAVDRQRPAPATPGPRLCDLPLSAPVRTWSAQAVEDLRAVSDGTMDPREMSYALLEGPPGTGKTLLAAALSKTAGWTFMETSVGAWFTTGDGALGGVAKNVRAFIDEAIAAEPAIALLDEIDALPDRTQLDARGRDWWTPIVTLVLTEIDRVRRSGKRVMLIGATNHVGRLDAALTRSGRLHQRVSVQPPRNASETAEIFRHYLGDDLADEEIDKLARLGRGATPAAVEGWVSQARSGARISERPLTMADVLAQMRPNDTRSSADVRAIALHEIGHAVVACSLGMPVRSVSIIPDHPSQGRTEMRTTTIVPNARDLMDTATILLAGRAADMELGAGANSGAEGDLATATAMLLAARQRQGLADTLIVREGPVPDSVFEAVDADLHRALSRAQDILKSNCSAALALTDRLVAEQILDGDDVLDEIGRHHATSIPRRSVPDDLEQSFAAL